MNRLIAITFSLILLSACASSAVGYPDGSLPDEASFFPHPEDWSSSTSHGAFTVKNGLTKCQVCHSSGDFEKCRGCHADYPHTDDFSTSHKAVINDRGSTSGCKTACHGRDLMGGESSVACNKCHTQYPHQSGWNGAHAGVASSLATDIPGQQFNISPGGGTVSSCTEDCHNDERSLGKTCRDCHSAGIHSENWADPANHGVAATGDGRLACATSCHGEDLSGSELAPACSKCHDGYPHSTVENWTTAGVHGTRSREDGSNCNACHDEASGFDDYYGSKTAAASTVTAPACYSCHPAYPHISYSFKGNVIPWDGLSHSAHQLMIMRNRQLFSSGGKSLSDPLLTESVKKQCAFGPNGCHTSGRLAEEAPPTRSSSCKICH